ncbi:hypothetical protein NDU88_005726 [Pleurodeles waltl]|uniref:Uncharacterized protein n=1 Tax=Pleurodeles waltl TaxID=8319 RepID=A0AAV7UJS3_PLEWA|nr:hypothetical protein NDU88_005726 [Pleurodeles waltl]
MYNLAQPTLINSPYPKEAPIPQINQVGSRLPVIRVAQCQKRRERGGGGRKRAAAGSVTYSDATQPLTTAGAPGIEPQRGWQLPVTTA